MKTKYKEFSVGDTIEVISMDDIAAPHYVGKTGVIKLIDDANQIHTTIGGVALIPDIDIIRKVPNETTNKRNGENND